MNGETENDCSGFLFIRIPQIGLVRPPPNDFNFALALLPSFKEGCPGQLPVRNISWSRLETGTVAKELAESDMA